MFQKILKTLIIILAIGIFWFVFKTQIGQNYNFLYNKYFPCQRPIAYSIGTFDVRFGLSKSDFLKNISSAENIWESSIGKQLFVYKPDGGLKINLIYDSRQSGTVKIQELKSLSKNDQDSYNALLSKYNSMQADFVRQKVAYTSAISAYNAHQDAYNTEVDYWNKRGGSIKDVYDKLTADKASLQQELQNLQNMQTQNNLLIENINSVVEDVNLMARKLNLNVLKINTIATAHGEEFTGGLYHRDANGEAIDIFQYDNKQKLIRVLAHEFGHALSLEHTDGTKDIMYSFNSGLNDTLTVNDLTALKNLCGFK